jgi:hypothetical protein
MKKLLIISFYLTLTNASFACSCMHPPTYCETMQMASTDLLVIGYKINDVSHGMNIKIVQVLDGSETRDTITVWGDMGMLCRHYSSMFSINDTLVFSLHNCDLLGNMLGGGPQIEQTDDYHLSHCGIYYLDYSNGQVIGSIDSGVTTLSTSSFVDLHNNCSGPTAINERKATFNVYPNPANDILIIENVTTNYSLQIINRNGQLIYRNHINSNRVEIPTGNWGANGLYLLKVFDNTNTLTGTKKIMVY